MKTHITVLTTVYPITDILLFYCQRYKPLEPNYSDQIASQQTEPLWQQVHHLSWRVAHHYLLYFITYITIVFYYLDHQHIMHYVFYYLDHQSTPSQATTSIKQMLQPLKPWGKSGIWRHTRWREAVSLRLTPLLPLFTTTEAAAAGK